jgi:integrase
MLTGHVEDRGSSWRIIINTKPKRTIRNIKKSILKTEKEAERYAGKLADEIERGLYQDSSNMTVSAYFDKWIAHMETENKWEYKTSVRNKGIIDNYVRDTIGNTKLSQLKVLQLQEHIDWLQKNETDDDPGLEASTALKHYNLLHAAFKQAFKWELIPGNPMDKVDPPTVKKKYDAPVLPTPQAIVDFQEQRRGTMLYLPVLLSTTGSFRRGEVCAFQWWDLEWNTGRIWVRRSLQRVKGKGLKPKPYTKNNKIRSVVLPPTVIETLKREYMTRYEGDAFGLHGEDYICAWPDDSRYGQRGRPIAPDYLTHEFEKKKLPITFHGCRHSHDSMLARKGVKNKLIADRAGRDEVLTEKTYIHLQPDQQDEVALVVEDALYPKPKKKRRIKLIRKK